MAFRGGWNRYKRLKQTTDSFAGEASKLTTKTTLRAEFADGLEVGGAQFETIRDVLASLELGRVQIQAKKAEQQDRGEAFA